MAGAEADQLAAVAAPRPRRQVRLRSPLRAATLSAPQAALRPTTVMCVSRRGSWPLGGREVVGVAVVCAGRSLGIFASEDLGAENLPIRRRPCGHTFVPMAALLHSGAYSSPRRRNASATRSVSVTSGSTGPSSRKRATVGLGRAVGSGFVGTALASNGRV